MLAEEGKYARRDSNILQNPQEKQVVSTERGTDSGTPKDAGTLDRLAAELMKLSPADREGLAALLLGKPDNP
jgi:hypothetical protein